jgi:hypothetical protein
MPRRPEGLTAAQMTMGIVLVSVVVLAVAFAVLYFETYMP